MLRALGCAAAALVLAAAVPAAESPVADAAARGDVAEVRMLLRGGADVNAAQGDGMTALHWAARSGHAEMAEILLYAGADVAVGTRIGHYTPLHLAARAGHAELVGLLLASGADPSVRTTNSGATPLHLAAAAGAPEVLELLLAAGAEVDARENAWGQTPLTFAAAAGRVDAMRVLLGAGAEPGASTRTLDVAQMADADRAAERRISQFLAEFKEREGGGTDWRPAPSQVQAAIEAGREIQRRWPDVPSPGDDGGRQDGQEAAPDSAAADSTTVAEGPAEAGTEAEAVPDDSEGAVVATVGASPEGEGTPAEDEAAEDTATDDEEQKEEEEEEPRPLSYAQLVGSWGGLTPLLHAVRQGHVDAVKELLEWGADVNQPSEGDGTTPLLMAALNGQFDLALVLLQTGADPTLPSAAGTTPLFAVLERQWAPRASYAHPTEHQQQNATYLDVMGALLEAGADPDARLRTHLWYMEYTFSVLGGSGINLQGATPFWRAAYALDVEAMRLLRDYGADTGIPSTKPPQRRRRRPPPMEEQKAEETADSTAAVVTAEESPADEVATDETEGAPPEGTTPEAEAAEGAEQEVQNPTKANAEGESAEEEQRPRRRQADDEEDHSGVPPVPVNGPAIFALHAASGVGYGQSFAGNAHRYVPDAWLAAVRFLVEECDADVNARDHNAFTALHHAAARGDNEMILYLVSRGADVTVLSRRGQTVADMANGPVQRVSPFPETVALLEKLGSKNNHECVSC